jgi:glycosyltransferase involved in cell wall biosynthesis
MSASCAGRASPPITVAHVVLSLRTGGLERVAVDLVNCAAPEFRPMVVCLETMGPMADELRRPGIVVEAMHRPAGFRPWLSLPLARRLWHHGVRVVHTHNSAAGFYGALAARLAAVPVVHTKHGQNLGSGNHRGLNRIAYRLTDAVVAVSGPARELALSEGARPHKLSIIDNGVDTRRFCGREEVRTATRARLALGVEDVAIGSVGRLAAVKNYPLLVQSATDAARRLGRTLTLVLVGDGPERDRLAALGRGVPSSLRMVLPGVGRAEDWLPAFDVFAMSSDSEGLPVALLEAMACGLPAVVTSVGAIPEVVDHGRAGRLVAPGDRNALAAALAALAGDEALRAAVGSIAAARVAQRYSAARMAREYEAVYRSLIRS